MINQFLIGLSEEAGSNLYSVFGTFQYPVYLGMLCLTITQYSLTRKQKILLCAAFVIAFFWGNMLLSPINRLTKGLFPKNNMGVSFLYFLLIVAAEAYMLKIPVLLSLDALIPIFLLGRGVAILGCIFAGCCHGYPCVWGIYSSVAKTITFPTVILDSMISCMIVGYLFFLARKSNYTGEGRVAAKGLVLFGALRTIVDILRDNKKLIFLCTTEGFIGMLYVVVGIRILHHIDKKQRFSRSIYRGD